MDAIGFIENEITYTKSEIIKNAGTEFEPYLQRRLDILKQIKLELEAWYAVKRNMDVVGETAMLQLCLFANDPARTKDFVTITKALLIR